MQDQPHSSDQPATPESVALRSIAWRDLCPWLLLFRCPRLALRGNVLLLATAGGVLTALAWYLSGWIFYLGTPAAAAPEIFVYEEATPAERQAQVIADIHRDLTRLPGGQAAPPIDEIEADELQTAREMQRPPFGSLLWRAIIGGEIGSEPFHNSWRQFVRPYVEFFSLRTTLQEFAYLLFGSLLTLLVWSFFGGAITRIAAVELAHEERIGLGPALRFALGKLLSYFSSPLLPLIGTAMFALGVCIVVGLPMNLDGGLIWSGLVWLLVLIIGLFIGVLLLGLLFGWPLMWATISTEGTDTFDALSRTYAYTLQRPLHYLFYVVLVGALGALTWLLVLAFGEAVIHISWWAADWGVFDEQRMQAIVAAANGSQTAASESEISSSGKIGIWMFRFANGTVRAVTYSFAYGFFWVATSGIYLLLRREVDHTETDEVYLDDDSEAYGLPPLKEDDKGVPTIAEQKANEDKSGETDEENPESDHSAG